MSTEERICRRCLKVRTPPIEGSCPGCNGFYRTIRKRPRVVEEAEDEAMPEGPVPVGALLEDEDPAAVERRHKTGLAGVDHVFGNRHASGIPEIGTVLFCATGGSGKTTWLFELFLKLRQRSLLLSPEQSKEDLRRQFSRLGTERIQRASRHMFIEHETEFDRIIELVEQVKPTILAVDSLHEIEGVTDEHGKPLSSGGDRAVLRSATVIGRLARRLGFFGFLVGHMANDGNMMGGAHLRHKVDGVLGLYRVRPDDDKDPRRILRFKGKARFAELGREALFKMTDEGLKDCGPILSKKDGGDSDPKPTGGPPKLRLMK